MLVIYIHITGYSSIMTNKTIFRAFSKNAGMSLCPLCILLHQALKALSKEEKTLQQGFNKEVTINKVLKKY